MIFLQEKSNVVLFGQKYEMHCAGCSTFSLSQERTGMTLLLFG